MKKIFIVFLSFSTFAAIGLYYFPAFILTPVANILIVDDVLEHADGVVILNSGVELYDRLLEGAAIYKQGLADKVIINGNRKNETVKRLEAMGYKPDCSWDANHIAILELLGVNREDIISISAPDAYDTVSESQVVAKVLSNQGMNGLIIATSKTHTARAIHIWRSGYGDTFVLQSAAAKNDPFSPDGWWQSGRKIRWILYEYGSWLFYYWKKIQSD